MQVGFERLIEREEDCSEEGRKRSDNAGGEEGKGGEWNRVAGELVEDDRVDKLNSRSSHGNF